MSECLCCFPADLVLVINPVPEFPVGRRLAPLSPLGRTTALCSIIPRDIAVPASPPQVLLDGPVIQGELYKGRGMAGGRETMQLLVSCHRLFTAPSPRAGKGLTPQRLSQGFVGATCRSAHAKRSNGRPRERALVAPVSQQICFQSLISVSRLQQPRFASKIQRKSTTSIGGNKLRTKTNSKFSPRWLPSDSVKLVAEPHDVTAAMSTC